MALLWLNQFWQSLGEGAGKRGSECASSRVLFCSTAYGIIPPATIDGLILKKQMENNLDELEECVDTAFAIIDQDRDGLITTNDIYRLMIHLGEVLWDEQVNAILQAADVDGDGRISKKGERVMRSCKTQPLIPSFSDSLSVSLCKNGERVTRRCKTQPLIPSFSDSRLSVCVSLQGR